MYQADIMSVDNLIFEDTAARNDCVWCTETHLTVGEHSLYGAAVVCKIGGADDGWFAMLSPKNDGYHGNFTVQLMPFRHLTHFGQMVVHSGMAVNYGILFATVCNAMLRIMAEENNQFAVSAAAREVSTSIATYGKCTNWEEKKEHLHIKVFPFQGGFGQPTAVDSSFGRKVVYDDNDGEFVKMIPVRKMMIEKERFEHLKQKLISLCRNL
jgi:hypothetical protein